MEDLRQFWVDIDHHIFLGGDFVVSDFDLIFYPICELIFKQSGTYITEPLLRHLGQFEGWLRQIVIHLWVVLIEEDPDLFHSKPFVPEY